MKKINESICNYFAQLLNQMIRIEQDILEQQKNLSMLTDSSSLKTIIDDHIVETNDHIQKLYECVGDLELISLNEDGLDKRKKTLRPLIKAAFEKQSEAIYEVIRESQPVFEEYLNTSLHDYAISSGIQSLELGEIVAYQILISLAKECRFEKIEGLLEAIMLQEMRAYSLLRTFSEQEVKVQEIQWPF